MKRIDLNDKQKSDANAILSKYTKYFNFSKNKEDAYKFTNIIGVKICPYCNIEYIYTVFDENGEPIFRPDIDHFIPNNSKTGNPELQLEIENLIPSCTVCNERLKRDIPFSKQEYIHPYFDDFDSIMTFYVDIKGCDYLSEENFDIRIGSKRSAEDGDVRRAERNISIFKLRERYQFHKDVVVNLFKRIAYYNADKQNEILARFLWCV